MSNLIENLGGYEEAKKQGEEWSFDDTLNKALLEYRRQHSIFEVGDKVVYTEISHRDKIYEISGSPNDLVWIKSYKGRFINERVEYLIHATDEEIKAGCRLD